MKIRMTIEVDVSDNLFDPRDKEEREFAESVFLQDSEDTKNELLILHSNYYGEEVGTVRVLRLGGYSDVKNEASHNSHFASDKERE